MLKKIENITETELREWIRSSIKTGSNTLSSGYQGNVYLYEGKGRRLIIKVPIGWGLGRFIRMTMLRNEHKVYTRLSEIKGIPRCFGMLDGQYLILEYIDGVPIRFAEITDHEKYFKSLLKLIEDMHKTGVAHTDLKKKDNHLVVDGNIPYVIDFGVAVIRKPGFAPLNRYLYNLASRFDLNAWVKLKYNGIFEKVSEDDKIYYNRTIVEKVARGIKDIYLKCIKDVFFKQER